jgi:hypothetical protein
MMILRSGFSMVALAFLWTSCGNGGAQKVGISSTSAKQQVMSLDFTNNGQLLTASVSQQIEITLGTIGGPRYGEPLVSSPTIRLKSTALGWPPNPGGPSFTYIFEAVAEGEAQVTVPLIYSQDQDLTRRLTFTVTIRVGPATGGRSTAYSSRTPDQANTASWTNAWTNLLNDVRQTFKPSLPRLTGVEVQLVVANPGAASDEVTMTLVNAAGEALAEVSKTVPVAECSHVLFLLPKGGARVLPGQVYGIQLNSDSGLFGWKYVLDGYTNGAASFNGKPLLQGTRSTFLFRTFGAK